MTPPSPAVVRFDGPWRHRDVRANGIKLHVVEAGPDDPDAPLIILLHGFADFWATWRLQLPLLGAAGMRAVAVDLRGYGDSDKPPRGYDGWTGAGDVAGLIRSLGYSDATVVGHADGGLAAWATAILHPRVVRSLVLISAPHPIALRRAVLTDPAQARALMPSLLSYQPPLVPERRLVGGRGIRVERMLAQRSEPSWRADPQFRTTADLMRTAIRIPGVAHAALEYQRWAFRSRFRPDGHRFLSRMDRQIDGPALHLHGLDDPLVLTRTVDDYATWAPRMRVDHLPRTGHWAHLERPEEIGGRILDFAATTER
ncbi:alpha/beta fold hydrolase [Millisia brevis]|uniref:alpha/beta fold hydrolase n=1 Tax=Millisia brevis TaxID=264148 RepID=UPI0008357526|nr:alpha/beta hydrolase [Millisia brevis]